MSTQQLTEEALSLPLRDRVALAEALWRSIDTGLGETPETDAVRDAMRRDQELSTGVASPREHADVLRAARSAIGCG